MRIAARTARSSDEAARRRERAPRRARTPAVGARTRSSMCATSRRATPKSRRTTTRSGTARSSGSTTASSRTTTRCSRATDRARRAADDRRLRGDLRAHGASAGTIRGRSPSCAAPWRRRGSTSVTPRRCSSRADVFARSGSAARPTASTSPPRGALSRSSPPRCERGSTSREVREGRLLHVVAGRVVRERRFRPDRRYREDGALPPVRAPREAVSCLERLAALASIAPA